MDAELKRLTALLEGALEQPDKLPAVFATMGQAPAGKVVMPDFAARRKEIWGDRVFTAEEVEAMRRDELENEEG